MSDFLESFTSGRYHRDVKILKILASNYSGSEFMAFFVGQLLHKITSTLKNFSGYVF